MDSKIYFRMHPLQWQFEGDGQQLYRALELADGSYMVSWKVNNQTTEVVFEQEEVLESMALGHWIITDENGEL